MIAAPTEEDSVTLTRRTLMTAAAATALTTPAIAQDRGAQTLRFVPSTSLVSLDPVFSTALVAVQHGYYVFDTLYGVDAQLKPKPQMAERADVSAAGRVWTIRLREGLKFHDGSPVRAADCVASLLRWSQIDTFGKTLALAVDRYEAASDRELKVHLQRPFPRLLEALGKPHSSPAFIMPERLARTPPSIQVTEMIGSGPYRFLASDYVPGSRMMYEKFDGYVPRPEKPEWTSGGKVAHFARIAWQVIPDQATAAAALQSGEVDWLEHPSADLLPIFGQDNKITRLTADPLGTELVLRFNTVTPPFDKPGLRRFVAAIVNQPDYLATVTGSGEVPSVVCRAIFPCTLPGHAEIGKDVIAALAGQKAKYAAALQAAGYAGETIVILNPSDSAELYPLGEVTADLLKQAGMKVDLQTMDWGTLLKRRLSKEPADRGGWSIFHSSWPSISIANPVLNTTIRGEGARGWPGWYDSPEMERLVQNWLSAESPAEAEKVAGQVEQLALRDMPTVPLGIYLPQTAYRADLQGVLAGSVRYPWNVRRV